MTSETVRVIGLLRKNNKVLLGEKTEGIGQGNYIAIGGKQESGETEVMTLKRELQEEIHVEVIQYEKVAKIRFEFEEKSNWNQTVVVFICDKWKGKPSSTDEIIPKWFNINKMPYTFMWEDASHWYPFILFNRKIKARFTYGNDNKTLCKVFITSLPQPHR